MHILVLNNGSSSIKFSIFEAGTNGGEPRLMFDGDLGGIGLRTARVSVTAQDGRESLSSSKDVAIPGIAEGLKLIVEWVCSQSLLLIGAVGYRVVHPGANLRGHQRITAEVLKELEGAFELAPLHDPDTVRLIEGAMKQWPDAQHFACFDTVFHQSMPAAAFTYPLPSGYRDRGVRRYGFHGLSCESVVRSMRASVPSLPRRLVIAHLGSGCSVTAVQEGSSVDTTMGMTPTGGVVMGTRPGDLDPGVCLYLLRQQPAIDDAVGAVESELNHKSGLAALTDLPNDMRVIRAAAREGNSRAILALDIFTRSINKAIGGFCWLMGGLDAIVFSGGIGEHDEETRSEVLAGVAELGVSIDKARNANGHRADTVQRISTTESKTAVFVVPAQENLMIAVHVSSMAGSFQ